MSERQSGRTVLLAPRPVPARTTDQDDDQASPPPDDEPAPEPPRPKRLAWFRWWMLPASLAPLALATWLVLQSDTRRAIDTAPEDALLVLDVDVRALRESSVAKVGEELVRAHTPLEQLSAACGFAVLERLDEAALSVGNGTDGGLGVALRGSLSRQELDVCQRALTIAAEGGSANRLGESSARGGYMIAPMHLAERDVALAVGLRRPLVLGTPAWVEQMVDASEAPAPNLWSRFLGHGAGRRGRHAQVQAELERRAEAGASTLWRATFVAPSGLEALLQQAKLFLPTEALRARARAFEAPRAAGASMHLHADGSRLTLRIVIDAGEQAAAEALRDVLLGLRLQFSQKIELRLAGLGPLLDRIHVQTTDNWVELSLDDRTEEMVKTLQVLYGSVRDAKGTAR